MEVLIVRDDAPAFNQDGLSDIVVIGVTLIDFPIDFGPMMDRWGRGVAVATITPIDGDDLVYRVESFQDIPATFRQVDEDAFVLDDIDGAWFLSLG